MKRTALVLGGGGLNGSYSAGVASALEMEFQGYYGSSVGVFATTFHLTGQRQTIESTWKNHVDGTKLVEKTNALKRNGSNVLKLEYLIGTFQNSVSYLDTSRIPFAQTRYFSGEQANGILERAQEPPRHSTHFSGWFLT